MKTRADLFAEQAQASFRRGQGLLAAGEADAAVAWLERACRFAPEDLTLRCALGLAWLRHGDPGRAAPLLEAVARACDAGEAWFALASARARLGASSVVMTPNGSFASSMTRTWGKEMSSFIGMEGRL